MYRKQKDKYEAMGELTGAILVAGLKLALMILAVVWLYKQIAR